MASEQPAILAKIHAAGYWRVVLRPTQYAERRIPTLGDCQKVIEEARVRLRGWDYPHIDRDGMVNRQHWVESTTDRQHGHIEYWRLHQSGQFVHHFAMREDYEETSKDRHGLDFLNTLYTFTEILEFAARLTSREVFSSGAEVRVELHGCEDRRVISWGNERELSGDYVSAEADIGFAATLSEAALLGQAAKIAMDGTVHVLERFNWVEIPHAVLAEEQAKLLERRL